MTFPDWLANPGLSKEFTAWLRKFMDNYIPASVQNAVKSGLFFNRNNQDKWLSIATTSSDPVHGEAVRITSMGAAIFVQADVSDSLQIDSTGVSLLGTAITLSAALGFVISGHPVTIECDSGSTIELKSLTGAGGSLKLGRSADKVGFYGVAPVSQAAHPSTLSDVITILQNLGLCA